MEDDDEGNEDDGGSNSDLPSPEAAAGVDGVDAAAEELGGQADTRSAYSSANTASEVIPQLSHPSEGLYIDPYIQARPADGLPQITR
eukprot:scaffold45115_cov21-Prasinocladus_malaysianus.AAC.1